MTRKTFKRVIALTLACSMGNPFLPSAAAFATQSHVRLESHLTGLETTELSKLKLDGVEAPRVGSALDDMAVVSTAEGESWEVPVLWIDGDLELATQAEEGKTYLPAIAFFVPAGFSIQQTDMAGGFAVELSDSLIELFGGEDVVAMYDDASEVTYVLPMSLRYYFGGRPVSTGLGAGLASALSAPLQGAQALQAAVGTDTYVPSDAASVPTPDAYIPGGDADDPAEQALLVDVYCAQTITDSLANDDLASLVELVVTRIQPEAVQLLRENYPSFDASTLDGAGVGLYLFCSEGPIAEETWDGSYSLIVGSERREGVTTRYGYMVGVDISSFVQLDEQEQVYLDPSVPLSDELFHLVEVGSTSDVETESDELEAMGESLSARLSEAVAKGRRRPNAKDATGSSTLAATDGSTADTTAGAEDSAAASAAASETSSSSSLADTLASVTAAPSATNTSKGAATAAATGDDKGAQSLASKLAVPAQQSPAADAGATATPSEADLSAAPATDEATSAAVPTGSEPDQVSAPTSPEQAEPIAQDASSGDAAAATGETAASDTPVASDEPTAADGLAVADAAADTATDAAIAEQSVSAASGETEPIASDE